LFNLHAEICRDVKALLIDTAILCRMVGLQFANITFHRFLVIFLQGILHVRMKRWEKWRHHVRRLSRGTKVRGDFATVAHVRRRRRLHTQFFVGQVVNVDLTACALIGVLSYQV